MLYYYVNSVVLQAKRLMKRQFRPNYRQQVVNNLNLTASGVVFKNPTRMEIVSQFLANQYFNLNTHPIPTIRFDYVNHVVTASGNSQPFTPKLLHIERQEFTKSLP